MFKKRLPLGTTEFNTWATRIIKKSGLPDNDSTRFALATTVLHAPAGESRYSDTHFVKVMQKAAANQIAAQILHDLKEKQQAEALRQQEEEKAAKAAAETQQLSLVEATNPSQESASDEQAGQQA